MESNINISNESENNKNIKIFLWQNGQKKDSIFEIELIKENISNLRKFKEYIQSNYLTDYRVDDLTFYDKKGLEIENSDINALKNNDVLFYLNSSEEFLSSNQYNLYEFVKWIKSGGYGQVFLAKNVIDQKTVAIKQIGIENFNVEELYNISRENVYLQSLTHKNIIQYYGNYIFDKNVYIVMDYAEGGELGKYIEKNGPLSEIAAKKIFRQIYDGVCYIHSKSIIHRDLKPNNILFLDKECTNIAIIDFGISGFYNGNSKEIIKAGTLVYSPPEIVKGKDYSSSPKVDIWSLGVILFYMLYKELPFKGNKKDTVNGILGKNPNFNLKGINKKLSGLCLYIMSRMMAKNDTERIELNDPHFNEWFNNDTFTKEIDEEYRKNIKGMYDGVRFFDYKPKKSIFSENLNNPIKNNLKDINNSNDKNEKNPPVKKANVLKKAHTINSEIKPNKFDLGEDKKNPGNVKNSNKKGK